MARLSKVTGAVLLVAVVLLAGAQGASLSHRRALRSDSEHVQDQCMVPNKLRVWNWHTNESITHYPTCSNNLTPEKWICWAEVDLVVEDVHKKVEVPVGHWAEAAKMNALSVVATGPWPVDWCEYFEDHDLILTKAVSTMSASASGRQLIESGSATDAAHALVNALVSEASLSNNNGRGLKQAEEESSSHGTELCYIVTDGRAIADLMWLPKDQTTLTTAIMATNNIDNGVQVLGFDLPLPTHVSEPTLTAYIFDVETETNCPQ